MLGVNIHFEQYPGPITMCRSWYPWLGPSSKSFKLQVSGRNLEACQVPRQCEERVAGTGRMHTATLFNLQGCIHHISAGFQQSVSLIFPQACDALEGAVLGLKAGEVKMAGTARGRILS